MQTRPEHSSLKADFLRRPIDPKLRWEGGSFLAPMWVVPPEDPESAHRPWVGSWIDLRAEQIRGQRPQMDDGDPVSAALLALREAVQDPDVKSRPGVLEVADRDLAAALEAQLEGTGVRVVLLPQLANLDAVRETMRAFVGQESGGRPPLTSDETIDTALLEDFATAALALYDAPIWSALTPDDVILLSGDGIPWEAVMLVGRANGEPSLLLFEDEHAIEGIEEFEGDDFLPSFVDFPRRWEIHTKDHDAWQAHGLSITRDGKYPNAVLSDGETPRLPSKEDLAQIIRVLDALSSVDHEQVTRGAWHRETDGESLDISIPSLLESEEDILQDIRADGAFNPLTLESLMRRARAAAMAEADTSTDLKIDFPAGLGSNAEFDWAAIAAKTPAAQLGFVVDAGYEAAFDMMGFAYGARGSAAKRLTLRALTAHPDCADAYKMLSELSTDPAERLRLAEESVAAARRWIDRNEQEAGVPLLADGDTWTNLDARPYLRARSGLALTFFARDDFERAAPHLEELLRLDPEDHLGVGLFHGAILVQEERWEDLWDLRRLESDEFDPLSLLVALGGWSVQPGSVAANDRPEMRIARASREEPNLVAWVAAGIDPTEEESFEAALQRRDTARLDGDIPLSVAAILRGTYESVPGALAWLRAELRRISRNREKRGRKIGKDRSKR